MTSPDSYALYLTRLKSMREGLTEPNRIKFIDDIFEALKYKDRIIHNIHEERVRLHSVIHQSILDHQDTKLKLEGCALRHGIPGWEIEKWLRMNPDQAVREVKFWRDWDKQTIELEHLINGTKPAPVYPVKIKYASKPTLKWNNGAPTLSDGIRIKPVGISLKDIVNNS